ncbi:MAG: methyltransferase domain-containing protein [Deinococcales bacterium]
MQSKAFSQPFSHIAKVYDAIMEDIDYDLWMEFILKELAKRQWQVKTILDIGCGTGNSLLPFQRMGFEVAGLDASQEMLGVARLKLPNVSFYQADFQSFELDRRFDLIISIFDSLNNLLEPPHLLACLQQIYKHLNSGGVVMFDVNTTAGLIELWQDHRLEGWVDDIYYLWTHEFDPLTKLATVHAYCADAHEDFTERHVERAYDIAEVKGLLSDAGFIDISIISEPFGSDAEEDDERIWALAKRP